MSDSLEIAKTRVVVRGLLEEGDERSSLKLVLLTQSSNDNWYAIEATYVWGKRLWQLRGGLSYCLSTQNSFDNWYNRGMGNLYRMVTAHDGQCHICRDGQPTEPIDPTNPVIMPCLCAICAEVKLFFSQRDRDLLQKRFGGYIGELMQAIRIREGFVN